MARDKSRDMTLNGRERRPRGCLATGYCRYLSRWVEQPITQALLLVLLSAVLFGPIQWICAWREHKKR